MNCHPAPHDGIVEGGWPYRCLGWFNQRGSISELSTPELPQMRGTRPTGPGGSAEQQRRIVRAAWREFVAVAMARPYSCGARGCQVAKRDCRLFNRIALIAWDLVEAKVSTGPERRDARVTSPPAGPCPLAAMLEQLWATRQAATQS